MPVKEVPYLPLQDELTYSPAMTEADRAVVEERMKELDRLLGNEKIAKYKLEVMFTKSRSIHKPFPGVVSFWENGTKLHGGGDAKLYVCPGKHLEKNDCESFIPDSSNGLNFIVCPKCRGLWRGEDVFGEVLYVLPMQRWTDVILSWFLKMDLNADIRIKFAREDIRLAAMKEQEKQMMGDLLRDVRSEKKRTTAIYRLVSIIKDTAAGADLRGRIHAFLTA